MSYRLISFEGIPLPDGDVENQNTRKAQEAFFALPGGGIFDYHQDQKAPLVLDSRRITVDGVVVASSHEALLGIVKILNQSVGSNGSLIRKRNEISRFDHESCTAKLLVFTESPMTTLMQSHVQISCTFFQLTDWVPS